MKIKTYLVLCAFCGPFLSFKTLLISNFFYRLEEYKTAAELALVIRKRYLSSS